MGIPLYIIIEISTYLFKYFEYFFFSLSLFSFFLSLKDAEKSEVFNFVVIEGEGFFLLKGGSHRLVDLEVKSLIRQFCGKFVSFWRDISWTEDPILMELCRQVKHNSGISWFSGPLWDRRCPKKALKIKKVYLF